MKEAKSAVGGTVKYPVSQEATALAEVDWDFPQRIASSVIEGLHPYPAKFITEIPSALLDILPIRDGAAVFDPFCGSGTTLVEGQRRGMPVIGIDLNPIAELITRVKTSPVPDNAQEIIGHTICRSRSLSDAPIPPIPNLNHWFKKPVQEALAACQVTVAEAPAECRDLLRLALSSIIVRVSNQDSDTRYAAVPKNVNGESVFAGFESAARRTIAALVQRDYGLSPATVIAADTLQISASDIPGQVGIVITSPPYPNAYDYWLYHKYRMWWLGFDPLAVKEREIGARAHFFKRNAQTPEGFAGQMYGILGLLRSVLVPGGFACFLMGRSKIHGRIIDNAALLETAAVNAGFLPVFKTERTIAPRRKSFNLSHAKIRTETLLVLKKGKDSLCA